MFNYLAYSMALSLTSQDVLVVLFTAGGYLIWRIYKFLAPRLGSPLSIWPGPPTPSWLYGNLREMFAVEDSALPDKLFERYGKVYVDREFFMVRVQSMHCVYPCSLTMHRIALHHRHRVCGRLIQWL